ncbi:MAG: hypothetical protein ACXACA_07060 [Candidatus Ranarchaeia archaeon]
MSKEKYTKDDELVFGPYRRLEGDRAIARMMCGKNAEKFQRTIPLLLALWGINIQQEDDEA